MRPIKSIAPSSLQLEEQIGEGQECHVYRTSLALRRGGRVRLVNGFVFKFFTTYFTDRDEFPDRLARASRAWECLRNANRRRKAAGKPTLRLPGTVRSCGEGKTFGFLMTDLSLGGRLVLIEPKELIFAEEMPLDEAQWNKVAARIRADLSIALEERIDLGSGTPFGVDAWLIILDPKTGAVDLCLSDIGIFTKTPQDPGGAPGLGLFKYKVEETLEQISYRYRGGKPRRLRPSY